MSRIIAIALAGALVGVVGTNLGRHAEGDDDPALPLSFEDERTDAMRKALKQTIDVAFKNEPLDSAIAQLSKRAGVSIHLDPVSLANAMVDRNQPVSVTLTGVHLMSVLEAILDPLNLTLDVRPDHFIVIDKESTRKTNVVQFHPVADLVVHHTGGWIDPLAETVIQLIQDTIDRDIWEPNGGDATIQFYRTTITLLIICPRDTHEKVHRTLDLLRRTREQTIQLLERHNLPALEDVLVQQDRAVGSPLGFFSPPQYPSASEIHGALSRLSTVESARNDLSSKVFELEREIQSLKSRLDPKPPTELKPIPVSPSADDSPPSKKKKKFTDDSDF